jgi:hypothetical protein
LAKEFGVSPAAVCVRFSERVNIQKTVAKQLADAETAVLALPVSEQISVRQLADELKAISCHLASAARVGSQTAQRLATLAHEQVGRIRTDGTVDADANTDNLKMAMTLTAGANGAAQIGMGLLAANKDSIAVAQIPQTSGLGRFYGSKK